MRGQLLKQDKLTTILRLSLLVANIISLIFLVVAVCMQQYFNTDGFGGFADGLPLAPVRIPYLLHDVACFEASGP